jgi:hypothetical protein
MGASESATRLLLVTTNCADAVVVTSWLRLQLPAGDVAMCGGFYPTVAELRNGTPAVVTTCEVEPREQWRLAELRALATEAAVCVVADATLLPELAGALHADLAVTSPTGLPPLRELLLSPASGSVAAAVDHTSPRRSRR